jgi:hypothetical protein
MRTFITLMFAAGAVAALAAGAQARSGSDQPSAQDVNYLQTSIQHGGSPKVVAAAKKELPTLRRHLRLARLAAAASA